MEEILKIAEVLGITGLIWTVISAVLAITLYEIASKMKSNDNCYNIIDVANKLASMIWPALISTFVMALICGILKLII